MISGHTLLETTIDRSAVSTIYYLVHLYVYSIIHLFTCSLAYSFVHLSFFSFLFLRNVITVIGHSCWDMKCTGVVQDTNETNDDIVLITHLHVKWTGVSLDIGIIAANYMVLISSLHIETKKLQDFLNLPLDKDVHRLCENTMRMTAWYGS